MPLYSSDFCGKDSELHFFGVSLRDVDTFAAGRVFVYRPEAELSIPESAIICLLEPTLNADTLISKSSPAALAVSVRALSAELLETIAGAGVPYMILKDDPSRLYAREGKVALLDLKRNVLVVDPSLDTLNRYPCLSLEAESDVGRGLIKEISKERYLFDADRCAELFETLRDTSEELGAPPITVMLPVPLDREDEEIFCERAEALFRAAVYGDLSVMLCGHVAGEDLSRSFSLMHRVFCRLEQEGREFNGYLKKGFLISSPADIMRRANVCRPDFLCFDIDTLLSRMFGAPCEKLAHSEDVKDALLAIWRRYLDDFAPDCPFWLKSGRLYEDGLLRDFSAFARIRDVYIERK